MRKGTTKMEKSCFTRIKVFFLIFALFISQSFSIISAPKGLVDISSLSLYTEATETVKKNKINMKCNQNLTGIKISNNNLIFCIGLQKTGTDTYSEILTYLTGHESTHSPLWFPQIQGQIQDRVESVSTSLAFTDGGGHYWDNPEEYEFGSKASFDPRFLHLCFPKSLYVLNTRPLLGWLVSKLRYIGRFKPEKSHLCSNNGLDIASNINRKFLTFAWPWILYREFYHRRVIDYAMEDPTFAKQLIITDLITHGETITQCILRKAYDVENRNREDIYKVCNSIVRNDFENQFNNFSSTNKIIPSSSLCFSQVFKNALEEHGYNSAQAGVQPLLVEPSKSGSMEQWLLSHGYSRFLIFNDHPIETSSSSFPSSSSSSLPSSSSSSSSASMSSVVDHGTSLSSIMKTTPSYDYHLLENKNDQETPQTVHHDVDIMEIELLKNMILQLKEQNEMLRNENKNLRINFANIKCTMGCVQTPN